jgi:diguanylate cyclase (GGDEF)-like protein
VPQKVLLIDDDEAICTLVRFILRGQPLEVFYCRGGEDGLAAVAALQPDLILMDVDMPAPDGFELCRRVKSHPATNNIPVIFLTGATAVEERVRGWELGAVDYITKPFEPTEVLVRVRAALRTKQLIDLLERKAMIDGLTGLYNRAHFEQRIEAELSLARRTGRPLSCVMLDVDHFKRINDTYGHLMGDDVLRSLAAMLVESCRTEDVVCRYGGEEFALLLPNTPALGATVIAERVREAVEERPFRTLKTEVSVTCSLGVAQAAPTETNPIERADAALYQAKREGRNRVVSSDPPNPNLAA